MTQNEFLCDCNAVHEDIVKAIVKKMPNEFIFSDLALFFKIIGDKTRCKILFALSEQELCVCDLANVLSMTKSSVSHQLAKMREYGLLKYRRAGKEVYYSLDDDHIGQIFLVAMTHLEEIR
ncbi:MAG: winged helix-turn-helix transcriptional regulator [Clostridia bacterium]|nr:winged helix-turn-helix transcriptional regulator [Clostridia bacterium]